MTINETGPEPDPPGLPLPPLPEGGYTPPPPGSSVPGGDQVTSVQILALLRATPVAAREAIGALNAEEVAALIAAAPGGGGGVSIVDNGNGTATIT